MRHRREKIWGADMPGFELIGDEERAAPLKAALKDVLQDLALQIVRDGEGATKFISVTINSQISQKLNAVSRSQSRQQYRMPPSI